MSRYTATLTIADPERFAVDVLTAIARDQRPYPTAPTERLLALAMAVHLCACPTACSCANPTVTRTGEHTYLVEGQSKRLPRWDDIARAGAHGLVELDDDLPTTGSAPEYRIHLGSSGAPRIARYSRWVTPGTRAVVAGLSRTDARTLLLACAGELDGSAIDQARAHLTHVEHRPGFRDNALTLTLTARGAHEVKDLLEPEIAGLTAVHDNGEELTVRIEDYRPEQFDTIVAALAADGYTGHGRYNESSYALEGGASVLTQVACLAWYPGDPDEQTLSITVSREQREALLAALDGNDHPSLADAVAHLSAHLR